MEDHWFDALNEALLQDQPRRSLLGAAALLASLGLGTPLSAMAKKGKTGKKGKGHDKKKERKKNKKSKVTPLLCDPYLLEACNVGPSYVSGEPAACEATCERCQREGTAFCLVRAGEEDYPRQPTCCYSADECCGDANFGFGECCIPEECCEVNGVRICLEPGATCCPTEPAGWCELGDVCCGARGCVRCEPPKIVNLDNCDECVCPDVCEAPTVPNPATCECEFPDDGCCAGAGPGFACCNGNCFGVENDDFNCGGCNRRCEGEWERCCNSVCVDARIDPNNCGQCGNSQPGQICCNRRLWPSDQYHCCEHPNGFYPCSNDFECCTNAAGQPFCCSP